MSPVPPSPPPKKKENACAMPPGDKMSLLFCSVKAGKTPGEGLNADALLAELEAQHAAKRKVRITSRWGWQTNE